MKSLLFSLFNNTDLFETLKKHDYEIGEIILRQFSDEETYIKINSDVKDRKVIFIASLDHPNSKLLPLLFAARTARDLEAKEIVQHVNMQGEYDFTRAMNSAKFNMGKILALRIDGETF